MLPGHRVLGERTALAGAVYLVASAQAGDPGADRRHHTGDRPTEHRHLGPTQPDREPYGHRSAGHQDPHARVDSGGAHLDQHVVGADGWPVDIAEVERVGRAVPVTGDRFHDCSLLDPRV